MEATPRLRCARCVRVRCSYRVHRLAMVFSVGARPCVRAMNMLDVARGTPRRV